VLGELPGDSRHFSRTPHKYVLVVSKEVDKLAFLFGVQAGPDLDGLGRVFGVNLYGLSILSYFEGARRGGHDRASVIPDFVNKINYSSHVCPRSFIPHTWT
jgi:hypothetical protein